MPRVLRRWFSTDWGMYAHLAWRRDAVGQVYYKCGMAVLGTDVLWEKSPPKRKRCPLCRMAN